MCLAPSDPKERLRVCLCSIHGYVHKYMCVRSRSWGCGVRARREQVRVSVWHCALLFTCVLYETMLYSFARSVSARRARWRCPRPPRARAARLTRFESRARHKHVPTCVNRQSPSNRAQKHACSRAHPTTNSEIVARTQLAAPVLPSPFSEHAHGHVGVWIIPLHHTPGNSDWR